jgi:hypothetical protein
VPRPRSFRFLPLQRGKVEENSRSVGVRDFPLRSFTLEDTVEFLALLCRRVLDLDRSSLRDDLLGSVRTNQALEAVRLHVYITLVSILLSLK